MFFFREFDFPREKIADLFELTFKATMIIRTFETTPEIHTETILLDYDILGMYDSIQNNIELTTDGSMSCTEEDIIATSNYLQELHQDYTKEEIIALAQKMIIESVQQDSS